MTTKPILFSGPMVRALLDGRKTQTRRVLKDQPTWDRVEAIVKRFPNQTAGVPFAVGDVLWVRETWSHTGDGVWSVHDAQRAHNGRVIYKAEGVHPGASFFPSIHMPRRFSRLTLAVTSVKVERLQDISKEDVIAEGITEREGEPMDGVVCGWHEPFAELWTSINGAGSWDANPWVVALTFTVHRCHVDAMATHVLTAAE